MIKPLFFCFLFCFTFKYHSQDTLKWNFYHPTKKEWMTFGTKGSIQQKLIEINDLPLPFKEQNDLLFGWIENYKWTLSTEIYCGDININLNPIIVFENIDTYGDVLVNGIKVYEATNYFIPHEVSLKGLLNLGINKIELILTPPKLYHSPSFLTEQFHYPAPNDNDSIFVSSRTRKPQFQFGWDWVSRINTIGIDKPSIFFLDKPKYNAEISIITEEINSDYSNLSATIKIDSSLNGFISSKYLPITKVNSTKSILKIDFKITEPVIWNARGTGEPNVYRDTLLLYNNELKIQNKIPFYFGIRKIELNQNTDSIGTAFELILNGNPIFCVGMNIVPPSIFLSELTPKLYDSLVNQIKYTNANMVRIWGGGTYFDDYFYEQCALNGIMIWQDFMFACAMYPSDSAILNNISKEIDFHAFRLSKHPSIVLFNGNNEVDVAWKNWGFQDQYKLSAIAQESITESYNKVFNNLIPSRLKQYSNLPYTHTSPLSNWGLPERYNHGSQHYWGVWHGTDDISEYSKNIGRFNSEYGFQSFPDVSTLSYITSSINWKLDKVILNHHQRSYVGNNKIIEQAKKYFQPPKSFEEFVYQSQLIQKDAMVLAIKSHRLNAPRCMGSLFWQFNDCYPGPTWSVIDFLGNPKALYYSLPYLFTNQTVFISNKKVIAVNNSPETNLHLNKSINLIFYTKFGKKISDFSYLQQENSWVNVLPIDIPKNTFAIEIVKNDIRNIEFIYDQKKTNLKKSVKINTITFDLKSGNGKIEFEVKKCIRDLWFYEKQGNLRFSNNFTSYLPGFYTVHFQSTSEPKKIDFFYR